MASNSTYAALFTQEQASLAQESPGSLVARILKERRKERELRALNKDRMQRYSDVAEAAKHYTTEGVTADLLRRRQDKYLNGSHRSSSTGESDGALPPAVARAQSSSSIQDGTACSSSTVANGLSERSASLRRGDSRPITATTTASSSASVGQIAVHEAPSSRTMKLQQKSHQVTEEECESGCDGEDDEGGGHVCVVKTNVSELLFTAVPQSATAAAIVHGRPVVGGGIPLSLRGAAGEAARTVHPIGDSRRTAQTLLPSTAVLPQTTAPAEPLIPGETAGGSESSLKPAGVPSDANSRRPARRLSVPPTAPKPLRSIIKRHPIPRKHNRRVHFSEDNLKETASQGCHLTLSKDGPPVSFDLNASLQEEMEEILSESKQQGVVAWGADSELFNKEWGLDPNGVSGTERCDSPTKSVKGLANRSSNNSTRQSFHTGLSVEEKRLLEAITQVNRKLQSKGIHEETRAARPQLRKAGDNAQRSLAPVDAAIPQSSSKPSSQQEIAATLPNTDGPQRPHRLLPPSECEPTRGIICGFENVGGMVNRAPVAVTSRTAAVATPVANGCRVVSAPPVLDVPAHITAALPTRKADHQAVTRRDRFGKKMSVIPK